MARYPVAWHALIVALRADPNTHWAEVEARVRDLVERDGGTKKLPSDVRATIITRVMLILVSGSQGQPKHGTSDPAYDGSVKRLARNIALDLIRQDPQLLRQLIGKPPVDTPLLGPETAADRPVDAKRLGRFARRFNRVPHRDRFLLRLVVIEEHTIAQIADQLKVSFADATTRLFGLFARLRP